MKRIKKDRRGGARRGSGRPRGSGDAWMKVIYKSRQQKRQIPYKLDSLENVIKAMDLVAGWVLKNEIDTGRALTLNSLMRTQVEILIPTEQQMRVKVLEDKVTRAEEILGIRSENKSDRRRVSDQGTP